MTVQKFFAPAKIVNAEPMTRLEYNIFRGWTVPADEDGADEGYLIEDTNGPKNIEQRSGYVSWVPKLAFDKAYRKTSGLTFGDAIEALRIGASVAREGWNGKNMFLFLLQGSNDLASLHKYGFGENLNEPTFADTVILRDAQNRLVAWNASQTDMLATDWTICL
jgi:hypothetical protein